MITLIAFVLLVVLSQGLARDASQHWYDPVIPELGVRPGTPPPPPPPPPSPAEIAESTSEDNGFGADLLMANTAVAALVIAYSSSSESRHCPIIR